MANTVVATANALANHWASLGNSYSLHTGNPGAAGTANEASGNGYARQTTTFGSPAGGTVTGSQMTFNFQGTATHMCRWNGTTLLDIIDTVDATITPAGQIKVTPSFNANYVAWT
ncbi:hypothetical protein DEU38_13411 [Rhodococcus sp. AG1013]|uniref:phage tail fiber protein n=1 Tax=Rhodococcus sp. AG1013 TaxID=2183996 RepID=UPI000E0AC969|nr:hypothetical protein [Rhodococcus sp. AG1013]RDI13436.1 hypothetical protein DEU38_13411 [Rhodococcus sp. AG1013]